jgi:hypothetical protein
MALSNIAERMPLSYVAIFVSALIGSGVAALADLLQKDTAGAVVKVQTTLAMLVDQKLSTLWAIVLLMILGAALCFVFQPETRKNGFTLGLSVISVVMTATPTKPPPSPAGLIASDGVRLETGSAYALLARPAASDWPLFRVQTQVQAQANLLRLNFEVRPKEQPAQPLGHTTIRVRELPSGKIWQWTTDQFRTRSTFPVQFFYDVPLTAGTTSIEARLEAEHYIATAVQSAVARGSNEVMLSFVLEKSALPTVIRKLFEQRAF